MQHIGPDNERRRPVKVKACLLGAAGFLACVTGCGSDSSSTSNDAATQSDPQTYFAPYVFSTNNSDKNGQLIVLQGPYIYQIDDTLHTFSQSTFRILPPQKGAQTINAGDLSAGARGLLALSVTENYVASGTAFTGTPTVESGGFAVELANRAGGLVQLPGQPAAPLVASQCPVSKTARTYQFITIPGSLVHAAAQTALAPFWDPALNTAYGSVDITSDGTNVTFANIHQYTLSSSTPMNPATSPVTGLCGPTVLGNTISVPGQLLTTDPGQGSTTTPQATIAIGSTGLLAEDNGNLLAGTGGATQGAYQNVLGDGTGAVGLPKPSTTVDINALRSAQYLGFVTGAGVYVNNAVQPATGRSSHLASFGFAATPSTCASVVASTSTVIYGGDFTKDDPSTSSDGFGNCDLAIDLGPQDSANNGLFPKAVVWLGGAYAANTSGKTYSFNAVAIAGQLNGKNAIFVIGADTTQPWSIYLMQSN